MADYDIKKLIPHRDPFLFVDRLGEVTKEKVVGYRIYKDSEPFFRGHFPDYPVVPGVILVETMAQCGGAGTRAQMEGGDDVLFFLASIDKVKFRRQVRPNDEVRFEITVMRASPRMIKQSGIAYVGDEVAAEAEWLCLIGSKDDL